MSINHTLKAVIFELLQAFQHNNATSIHKSYNNKEKVDRTPRILPHLTTFFFRPFDDSYYLFGEIKNRFRDIQLLTVINLFFEDFCMENVHTFIRFEINSSFITNRAWRRFLFQT